MKKTITTIIIVLLASLSASAQIFRSGGIGAYGTKTSYGRSGGGGLGSGGSGESKIYLGSLGILKYEDEVSVNGVSVATSLNYSAKIFAGTTLGKMLVTANYEYNLNVSASIPGGFDAPLNKRIYAEAIYPVLGTFNSRFAISLFAGAGVNMADAGFVFDEDEDDFILSKDETAFYAPLGVYIDLNVLEWYGFRFGYTFGINTSEYAEKTFDTEGFTVGSFFRF